MRKNNAVAQESVSFWPIDVCDEYEFVLIKYHITHVAHTSTMLVLSIGVRFMEMINFVHPKNTLYMHALNA